MPDLDKVIKAMQCRADGNGQPGCKDWDTDCPYRFNRVFCDQNQLYLDAIALLKEQEAKWIHREDLDFKDKLGCNHFHGMCGNCGFIHDFIDDHTGQYKYCPQCGQAVKWNVSN